MCLNYSQTSLDLSLTFVLGLFTLVLFYGFVLLDAFTFVPVCFQKLSRRCPDFAMIVRGLQRDLRQVCLGFAADLFWSFLLICCARFPHCFYTCPWRVSDLSWPFPDPLKNCSSTSRTSECLKLQGSNFEHHKNIRQDLNRPSSTILNICCPEHLVEHRTSEQFYFPSEYPPHALERLTSLSRLCQRSSQAMPQLGRLIYPICTWRFVYWFVWYQFCTVSFGYHKQINHPISLLIVEIHSIKSSRDP